MVDICMLVRIVRKDRKDIEKLLLNAYHKPTMFIRHLRNIIFAEFKLIDFTLLYRSVLEGFISVISPTEV